MFFEGSEGARGEIRGRMERVMREVEDFLGEGVVRGVLGAGFEGGVGGGRAGKGGGRREVLFGRKRSSGELERRRGALGKERRERVLCLMRELEVRIESDLRGVEDVLWPRRM